jgi:hypothetical protein
MKRGRKKSYYKIVPVRLDEEMLAGLEFAKGLQGVGLSDIIRRAVAEYLAKH